MKTVPLRPFSVRLPSAAFARSRSGSQIEDQVAAGLRTADQDVTVGGRIDGVGRVGHRPGKQSGLAIVTDAGATRPSRGHAARLSELEEARVGKCPFHAEAAASE